MSSRARRGGNPRPADRSHRKNFDPEHHDARRTRAIVGQVEAGPWREGLLRLEREALALGLFLFGLGLCWILRGPLTNLTAGWT